MWEFDFILLLVEEMVMKLKCLVQVKTGILGKSFTVIPVFNTFGGGIILKQNNLLKSIFLFCSKVDLYIQKCWKIIISNAKLLEKNNLSHNVSMYFIPHRKSADAVIGEERYRYFLCMCLSETIRTSGNG